MKKTDHSSESKKNSKFTISDREQVKMMRCEGYPKSNAYKHRPVKQRKVLMALIAEGPSVGNVEVLAQNLPVKDRKAFLLAIARALPEGQHGKAADMQRQIGKSTHQRGKAARDTLT